MTFGARVRKRRQALGMTLEQLAERCRLSANYVGTLENKDRDPSLSTVVALAKALKLSPAELLGGADGLSAEAVEAGRLFDGVSEDLQEAVLGLLRAVPRRRR